MTQARKKNGTEHNVDAIDLLKADHRAVAALFEKFETTKANDAKAGLAQQICLELCIHTAIEEELFYPALNGKIESDMLDEAYVEHDGAKMLIAEILASAPGENFFDAKVKVLSEDITHHVKEEEQRDGLFAQARKTDVDMTALGAQMQARKDELKALYKRLGPPTPETRSMRGATLKTGKPIAHATQ